MLTHTSNKRGRNHRGGSRKVREGSPFSKIGNPIEELAYVWALDSSDCESNEHWGNWSALVEFGPKIKEELRTFYGSEFGFLNRAERKEILGSVGFVFHESSQGFISIDWYGDQESLKKAWKAVQESYDDE